MAKQPGLDFQSAKGGLGELKRRLLFVIGALIVFRIGSFIPIPGIDAAGAKLLEQQRGTMLRCLTCSLVVLSAVLYLLLWGSCRHHFGVDHYPAATVVHPTLAEIKKEGSLVVVRSAITPTSYSGAGNIPRSVLLPVCRICLYARR